MVQSVWLTQYAECTKDTRDFKLFTIPGCKYEKKNEVAQWFEADMKEAAKLAALPVAALQLPAASRRPKQLPISVFFQAWSYPPPCSPLVATAL